MSPGLVLEKNSKTHMDSAGARVYMGLGGFADEVFVFYILNFKGFLYLMLYIYAVLMLTN